MYLHMHYTCVQKETIKNPAETRVKGGYKKEKIARTPDVRKKILSSLRLKAMPRIGYIAACKHVLLYHSIYARNFPFVYFTPCMAHGSVVIAARHGLKK